MLTAQPSLDHGEINRNQMRLAMCVGDGRHYRIDQIQPRHFLQTAKSVRVPESLVRSAMAHVVEHAAGAFDAVTYDLGDGLPQQIHDSVRAAAMSRIEVLAAAIEQI